ncbi:MAG: FAD binding domain-containing protein [Pseudomonadota bacterium]
MHLPKFEHIQASSMEEAAHLLNENGLKAQLVAGGTDLYLRMKYGLIRPERIISLKGIPVKPPAIDDTGDLHIDPLTTLADLARSAPIIERAPLIAEAALSVGSNQVRHMGTLGGNLCLENRCPYYNQTHSFQFMEPCFKRNGERCYLIPEGKKCWAIFSADTVPALISLGALITVTGPEKSRQIALERLYTGDALKPLAIAHTEILTKIIVPAPPPLKGYAFLKFSLRGGMEFAILNVAVFLDMADETHCRGARITVGGLSASPVRIVKAEEALTGEVLSKGLFHEVALMAASEAHPFPNHSISSGYLRECLRVQTLRALTLASTRVHGD